MERLELERKGLGRDLSWGMVELRIRFSVRMEPENGSERGLVSEVVLVGVKVSGMVGLGWVVDNEEIRGGSEESENELNLFCSCFSCSGGGERC